MRGDVPESRRARRAAGLTSGRDRLTGGLAARTIAVPRVDSTPSSQAFTQSPVRQISAGVVTYLIGRIGAPSPVPATDAHAPNVLDAGSATNVLQRCVGDRSVMQVLRTQLAIVVRDPEVASLSDAAVVDRIVSLIAQRRLHLLGPYPPALARERVQSGALSTRNVLQRCLGDHYAMRMLRAQLTDALRDAQVPQLSDVAVIHRVASLVAQGRLHLRGPFVPLRAGGAVATVAEPAPSPAAPAPRSTARSTTTATAAEPSFAPNADPAALAATLTDAAKDGTPFCEECARAARAA